MTVFFFDDNQQLIKQVGNKKLIECTQEKEISENKDDLIKNTLRVTTVYDSDIEFASFMAVEEQTDEYSLYRILQTNDPENKLEFIGSDFAYNELDGYIVKEIRPQNEGIVSVATRLLDGTGWKIKNTSSGLGTVSGSFYYTSVRESLKTLQTYGCEIEFRCSLESNGIKEKWINIYSKVGHKSDKRFTFGDKALEIVRTIDRQNLYTSVIGRGKGEEVGETSGGEATYGRRIEFADVVWSKAKGDPLDKPKGQIFLENPELTAMYGIPVNSSMRKRETVVIFEDEEDPAELLKKTYEQLQYLSRPLFQFKTTVLEGDALGNTVTIHHYEKRYHYETRVFKTTLDRLTGNLQCELGDNIVQDMSKRTANQINSIQDLETNKTSYYDATKITKWQSDVIRGASEEGGNVFLMSPSDLGEGTSRAPVCTVWMNGPNLEESNKFLVANNSGIGFIEGKFDLSKFKQAWTIDGILTLGDGMLQIGTEGIGKYLESTKNGLQFYNSGDKIGRIGAAAKPFPITDEEELIAEKALSIELDKQGKFIKLQASEDSDNFDVTGIYIPNVKALKENEDIIITNRIDSYPKSGINLESKGAAVRLTDTNSPNNKSDMVVITANRVDIKTKNGFYVDGVRIDKNGGGTGGGSGGAWNGKYPPEVTSDRDKRYWIIWAMAIAEGFTQEAAAALCGNAQGESDAVPNLAENGGYGYGIFQWTLQGTDGRTYMISLMNRAGITSDPDTSESQMKLLFWHGPNGQWASTSAYPYSWNEFKKLTSISTATTAFEKNFERPADSHPERVGWAQDWYNKFKNLTIPSGGSDGFASPVKPGTPVTSWFGQRWGTMHSGIDFGGQLNDPIFASKAGTVSMSLPTSSSGGFGEYVVIDHGDGYMSGYAHQNRRMVSQGDKVSQGQQIGVIGSTGDSTGPHLHFSIQTGQWGPYLDPAPFLGLTPS